MGPAFAHIRTYWLRLLNGFLAVELDRRMRSRPYISKNKLLELCTAVFFKTIPI